MSSAPETPGRHLAIVPEVEAGNIRPTEPEDDVPDGSLAKVGKELIQRKIAGFPRGYVKLKDAIAIIRAMPYTDLVKLATTGEAPDWWFEPQVTWQFVMVAQAEYRLKNLVSHSDRLEGKVAEVDAAERKSLVLIERTR